jgi:hypothetical protein
VAQQTGWIARLVWCFRVEHSQRSIKAKFQRSDMAGNDYAAAPELGFVWRTNYKDAAPLALGLVLPDPLHTRFDNDVLKGFAVGVRKGSNLKRA